MGVLRKNIAVIGAGFSGICSIVALKEENLEPVCYEKTDRPCGTWSYREESVIGVASTMPTTIVNVNKESSAFSNFPPDTKYSNYMPHEQMHDYIMSYAEKNDALKHIQLNTEVLEVKRTPDYEETGKWIVTVKHNLTGTINSNVFDGVMVCIGQFSIPKWPSFKGQEEFKGEIIHTHSLKYVDSYKNKKVVIVGMGCSGLDAAVDISNVSRPVYLSTRAGVHVIPRSGPQGLPFDFNLLRRYLTFFLHHFPSFASWIIENIVLDFKFNSRLYAIEPKWHLFSTDPSANDYIAPKLLTGSVILKKEIKKFTENGVIFDGDVDVTPADVVVMATGYTWKFPFLEENILHEKDDGYYLYKCIWPTELKHSSLAFIGIILPWGSIFPIIEMQCRYVAQVLAGHIDLPGEEERLLDVKFRLKANKARFKPSPKQSVRVDYIQYQDELAALIGAKPNLFKLLFVDPVLFYKLVFGPSVPYQYRLDGPHPWKEARNAIMTCEERIFYSLKQKPATKTESSLLHFFKKFILWLMPFI